MVTVDDGSVFVQFLGAHLLIPISPCVPWVACSCVCVTMLATHLLNGGGLEKWQHHNSETPSEPAKRRSIDQILSPCSARLSHRQTQDILTLTYPNVLTHTYMRTQTQ